MTENKPKATEWLIGPGGQPITHPSSAKINPEVVAVIHSKHGEPEDRGARMLLPVTDLQALPYGTQLIRLSDYERLTNVCTRFAIERQQTQAILHASEMVMALREATITKLIDKLDYFVETHGAGIPFISDEEKEADADVIEARKLIAAYRNQGGR